VRVSARQSFLRRLHDDTEQATRLVPSFGASRLRDSAGISPASLTSMPPGSAGREGAYPARMPHVTWIGHGTVLVDLDGVRLLTDPLLRDRVAHLRRHAPPAPPEALRSIDAVLLSHLHRDHLDLPSLRRVGRGVPIVVPRGGGRLLLRRGFHAVREIAPGEEVALGSLSVVATEARHYGGRGVAGVGAKGPALGYVISGSRRIYHAGDTDLFEGMRAIGATGLDLAFVPIWGWGSRLGPGHLNPLRAAQALRVLGPRTAVPIHWGTYAVGPKARRPPYYVRAPLEPFLAAACELAPSVRVVALEPGESLEL
jgi:L-ascorbate metabolism protein UlaG (beta-lactamase superfamily)